MWKTHQGCVSGRSGGLSGLDGTLAPRRWVFRGCGIESRWVAVPGGAIPIYGAGPKYVGALTGPGELP